MTVTDDSITVERYAYRDTTSQAGRPTSYTIQVDDIFHIRRWVNSNGNPTVVIHTLEGRANRRHTYMCVDDYGAENGLTSKPITTVPRRKDLFT